VPRFAVAPLGLTTEGNTKFKVKGWKCYLKKLQCKRTSIGASCFNGAPLSSCKKTSRCTRDSYSGGWVVQDGEAWIYSSRAMENIGLASVDRSRIDSRKTFQTDYYWELSNTRPLPRPQSQLIYFGVRRRNLCLNNKIPPPLFFLSALEPQSSGQDIHPHLRGPRLSQASPITFQLLFPDVTRI